MSFGAPLFLIVLMLVFSAAARRRDPPPLPVLRVFDVDATEVTVGASAALVVPIAEVTGVRFDDQVLELTWTGGGTRRWLVPPEQVEHVHRGVARLSASIERPALPIVATTHDGVRLNLDPVLSPVGPFLAVFAAAASVLSMAAAGGTAVIGIGTVAAARSVVPAVLFVLGLALLAAAVGLGAAQDLRVELAVEGRRLVVRRENRWWGSERSVSLADVDGVRVSGDHLTLHGPDQPLILPLGQCSRATAAVVRRFVLEQVERGRSLQGPVPAEMARLVDRADRE